MENLDETLYRTEGS
jgi:hypothetical protein